MICYRFHWRKRTTVGHDCHGPFRIWRGHESAGSFDYIGPLWIAKLCWWLLDKEDKDLERIERLP